MNVKIYVHKFWNELFLDFSFHDMNVEFIQIDSFRTFNLLHKKKVGIVFLRQLQLEKIGKNALLKIQNTNSRIIVIDEEIEPGVIIKSIQLGAHGYLWNPTLLELYESIYAVANGNFTFNSAVTSSLAGSYQLNIDSPLTRRENQILQELSKGCSYKRISENLFISIDTVRFHIRNIYYKLDAYNKDSALERARTFNLI